MIESFENRFIGLPLHVAYSTSLHMVFICCDFECAQAVILTENPGLSGLLTVYLLKRGVVG